MMLKSIYYIIIYKIWGLQSFAIWDNSLLPLSIQDLQKLLLVRVFLGFPEVQLDPQHLSLPYLPEKKEEKIMHSQLF